MLRAPSAARRRRAFRPTLNRWGSAAHLGRTAARVVLRWHLQRGVIVFPKSASPSRMAENFDVFALELASDELARIDALDRGEAGRTGPHLGHAA